MKVKNVSSSVTLDDCLFYLQLTTAGTRMLKKGFIVSYILAARIKTARGYHSLSSTRLYRGTKKNLRKKRRGCNKLYCQNKSILNVPNMIHEMSLMFTLAANFRCCRSNDFNNFFCSFWRSFRWSSSGGIGSPLQLCGWALWAGLPGPFFVCSFFLHFARRFWNHTCNNVTDLYI